MTPERPVTQVLGVLSGPPVVVVDIGPPVGPLVVAVKGLRRQTPNGRETAPSEDRRAMVVPLRVRRLARIAEVTRDTVEVALGVRVRRPVV